MFPYPTMSYGAYSASLNSVESSERSSFFLRLFYMEHLQFCQNSSWRILSEFRILYHMMIRTCSMLCMLTSALIVRVLYIVAIVTYKKMLRIAAARIVAFVKDKKSSRDRAYIQLIRKTMRFYIQFSPRYNLPVFSSRGGSVPPPTTFWIPNYVTFVVTANRTKFLVRACRVVVNDAALDACFLHETELT
jgi:hypothetical protein